MTIQRECARLVRLAGSQKGFHQINDLLMIAASYEKDATGTWVKKRSSAGDCITGFAIDPVTWAYEVGPKGWDHQRAKGNLIKRLMGTAPIQEIEGRVIDCRMAHVDGWHYPLITIHGMFTLEDPDRVRVIEKKILELGLGLPLNSLLYKYNRP